MSINVEELKHYPVITLQNVAWGDMDAFGHVNNVIYYRYIESARIDYLQQLGVLNAEVNTVVASSSCKYLKPVFFPDQLSIASRIVEIRNSAFRMEYALYSHSQNSMVATAEAVMVCVDNKTAQKANISEQLRRDIIALEKSSGNTL